MTNKKLEMDINTLYFLKGRYLANDVLWVIVKEIAHTTICKIDN